MLNPIRLLNLGPLSAGHTQAIYHVLAEQIGDTGQDTIVLCSTAEPYLCLGFHQIFESIFDVAACKQRNLPVYRRELGGGATYLDKNQIFYQCIFHHRSLPIMVKDIYAFALAAPVNALRRLGLNAELRDTNEIEVNRKRIAGTSGGRIGEATVIVGNLLFDFDFETMAAVWRTPTPAFRLLAGKAMRECMAALKTLPVDLSMEDAAGLLADCFTQSTGRRLEPGVLTANELHAITEKAEELASPQFLGLHHDSAAPQPTRALKITARASIRYDEIQQDGYNIRGNFWTMEGRIQEAILESMPERSWRTIEQALRGCPYQEWQERFAAIYQREPQ